MSGRGPDSQTCRDRAARDSTDAIVNAVEVSRREQSRELLTRARDLAEESGGVLSRAQLRAIGVGRDRVAAHVRAGRWRLHGRQSVAVHTGDLSTLARAWRAVHESGGDARIDGVSSLQAAGVSGLTDEAGRALPRAAVQQRIITPAHLKEASAVYCGRRRRALVPQLIEDIADGAHALGELDVMLWCRRRGLPAPSRQVLRIVDGNTCYLDVCWEDIGLALEIDGSTHSEGLEVASDHLRQNAITMGGELILRMNLVGLRLHREAFLDQIVEAYRILSSRGAF